MRTDRDGRGMVNILVADKLMQSPRLYATFLLWLLSELFEELPEVGDLRQAQAGLLLRRGASAVQRRAQGADRQDRAGRAADPLQGRRRLFRDAESDRRARQGARPTRQPRPACAARVHPARPEGGHGGGADVPPQSEARHRPGHHGTGQGRGAGVVSGREWRAGHGRARHDPAALGADRADHAQRSARRSSTTARSKANTTRRSIPKSAYEMLQKRVAGAAATTGGRRRGSSRANRRYRRDDFRHQCSSWEDVDRSGHRAKRDAFASPTRWSAGWLPISANRSAVRLAVRSVAPSCAARSADCCDDRSFHSLLRRDLPVIFRK